MHVEHNSCIYQSTVWFGLLFVILAAIFGALSFVQVDLRWAAILFLTMAVLDLLLFVILRYKLKNSGGNTNICAFFRCKKEGLNCCDYCMRSCFCLDYKDRRNTRAQSIRETAIARVERRTSTRTSNRTNGTVRSISQEVSQRGEIRARLRSLERSINLLFRNYTVVENRMNKLKNSDSSDRRYLVTRERVHEKLIMVQVCKLDFG